MVHLGDFGLFHWKLPLGESPLAMTLELPLALDLASHASLPSPECVMKKLSRFVIHKGMLLNLV